MTEIYLRLVDRILTPILLLIAIFLFLRGHDLPGGGFIAGLVAAAAIELTILALGSTATRDRYGPWLAPLLGIGLTVAVTAALIGMAGGGFFLGRWIQFEVAGETLKLGTPPALRPGGHAGRGRHGGHLPAAPQRSCRGRHPLRRAPGAPPMTALMLALLVGLLFACGTYLVLQRGQIKLVLGLGLFTHAINLALFGTGRLTRGAPPLVDGESVKAAGSAAALFARYADPLPQALILTAIVISFGMTAFIVMLIFRRDALTGSDLLPGELAAVVNTADPFAEFTLRMQLPEAADDYDLLQYELDELYDHPEREVENARE